MAPSDRLRAALAAIDDANAADPTIVTVRDRTGPKEIVHAELVTQWVSRLRPEAGDALLLAARGHHFRRWTQPRSAAPAGRVGYLRWRKELHAKQARELGAVLTDSGYDAATIAQVQSLVCKDGLATALEHDDVQVLEDALCLVFLETQLMDIAARLDPAKLPGVINKTARKMSAAGRAAIAEVPLGPGAHRLLDQAFALDVVTRYLDAMAAGDWDSLAATLAPDVERIGPYGDDFHGRAAYAAFLAEIIGSLSGYSLVADDLIADGDRVAVQLHETVDDGDARLRTDETVVFDVAGGLIVKVAVYLRKSERRPADSTANPETT
jgi:ketosteroid isomerase-like protein